jgi:hypothetical protein
MPGLSLQFSGKAEFDPRRFRLDPKVTDGNAAAAETFFTQELTQNDEFKRLLTQLPDSELVVTGRVYGEESPKRHGDFQVWVGRAAANHSSFFLTFSSDALGSMQDRKGLVSRINSLVRSYIQHRKGNKKASV